MDNVRRVKRVWKSRATVEGAGVRLKRAFGYQEMGQLDPFLLLDDFHSNDPKDYVKGFPWHPHRGIETITYVLRGKVEHKDSMGNGGVIGAGDVQWMTAGSGIIHQEMPFGEAGGEASGLLHGFQLWANLPARHKMMDPRYQGIFAKDIPELTLEGGAKVRLICGRVDGAIGPVKDVMADPEYLDVSLPANGVFRRDYIKGHRVFAYVVEGHGYFDPDRGAYAHEVVGSRYFDLKPECDCKEESLVLFDDNESVVIEAGDKGLRFLIVSGRPINEPIAWYGPIVMNTREELKVAFDEYEAGTFIKHR